MLFLILGAGAIAVRPSKDPGGIASGTLAASDASIAAIPQSESNPSAALPSSPPGSGQEKEQSGLMDAYGSPRVTPEQDLELLQQVLHTCFTAVRGAADQVSGSNAEVTAFLTGSNSEKLEFISREHRAVKNGELVDRWGAAIFFHFIAPGVVEIRSSGPDKKMWSSDDVQFPKAHRSRL